MISFHVYKYKNSTKILHQREQNVILFTKVTKLPPHFFLFLASIYFGANIYKINKSTLKQNYICRCVSVRVGIYSIWKGIYICIN
jgi:hypothetical protein